ncbi:MAG: hypothetical protein HQ539_00400 [Parcubacteria group bacterium]|nr:hypothetical protein [Parcubacteria group bacterium]
MSKHYCPYCLPTKRRSHTHFHVAYYLGRVSGLGLRIKLKTPGQSYFNCYSLWPFILRALSVIKIVKFENNPDQSELLNRSLIFFNEAKKMGIDIQAVKILGGYRNDFRFSYDNKEYYYESIPLFSHNSNFDMDDKSKSRALLELNNIPVPAGAKFTNKQKALQFAKQIDWPVVVKPCSGSLSQHVVCNISSEKEFLEAVRIVKKYRPDFIVEKYILGNLYRATVVGKDKVFCCHRERANVVGNGNSTIEQLIQEKNRDKKRGAPTKRNTTLHQIVVDDILISTLKTQGLSLGSVLENNQKVYLHYKHTLSSGCDTVGLTDQMHSDNRELFLQITNLLNTRIVGIDFICADISKSYKEQECAVLETNSLPYIDMHYEPSHGVSDEVAQVVWDIVLNSI